MQKVDVKFIKDHPLAKLPTYGSAEAAGADLYAVETTTIMNGERALVRTGLKCVIPPGYEIQVRPRSGLALKQGITVLNSPGTIDSDYGGELGVIILNTGTEAFRFDAGDRIAQIVVAPTTRANFSFTDESRKTERGEGGYGSTGA